MEERDRGSAAVELTLLAPLFVLLLLFVVAAGRLVSARLAVDDAAHQAARTLTLARTPASATDQARTTALAALAERVDCIRVDLSVDLAAATPGGSATVRLSCVVPLSDLTGLALPATRTITSSASSPVDAYRGSP